MKSFFPKVPNWYSFGFNATLVSLGNEGTFDLHTTACSAQCRFFLVTLSLPLRPSEWLNLVSVCCCVSVTSTFICPLCQHVSASWCVSGCRIIRLPVLMGAVWQAAQSSSASTLQAKLVGGLKEHSRERKIPLGRQILSHYPETGKWNLSSHGISARKNFEIFTMILTLVSFFSNS